MKTARSNSNVDYRPHQNSVNS